MKITARGSLGRIFFLLLLSFTTAQVFAQPAYVYDDKGKKLMDEKKWTEAIAQFDLAIKTDATYFESYVNRGRCQMELGKNDLALADLNQAVKLNANFAPAFYWRAKVNEKLGNDQLAIDDYTSAIRLNPNVTDTYVCRGNLYVKTNQDQLALNDYTKAISLDAKNAEVFFQRGLLYRKMKNDNSALADFNQSITLDPNMGKAYAERGKIEYDQAKYDPAIADLSKAITLQAASENVYLYRAKCFAKQGKNDDAIKDYSTIIDVYKTKDSEMFRERGDLYTLQKNYVAAIKDYNKALTLKKDDVTVLLSRANCYYQQGKTKYTLAETDYKKVIELEPKNAAASRGMGRIRFDQEKWQEAADYFTTAISNGATGEDYFFRAKCNYKLNKKKDCCADFDKAAELGYPGVAEEKKMAGCQ